MLFFRLAERYSWSLVTLRIQKTSISEPELKLIAYYLNSHQGNKKLVSTAYSAKNEKTDINYKDLEKQKWTTLPFYKLYRKHFYVGVATLCRVAEKYLQIRKKATED